MGGEGLVLEAARGDGATRRCVVDGRPMSIGRWEGASLRLDDAGVLPVHAVLDPEGEGRFRLISLAPEGCLVNGAAQQRAIVSFGDELTIGGYVIRVGQGVVTGTPTPDFVDGALRPPVPRGSGGERAIRATLRWQGTPIEARVLRPGQLVTVGSAPGALFRLPDEWLEKRAEGSVPPVFVAAACLDDHWHVAMDTPLRALEQETGRPLLSSSPRHDGPKAARGLTVPKTWTPLPDHARVRLDAGELSIELERVESLPLAPVARPPWWSTEDGQRAVILAMAAMFAVAVLRNPLPAPFEPEQMLVKQRELIAQFKPPPKTPEMEKQIERWRKLTNKDEKPDDGGSAKAKGEEGKAGRPDGPQRQARRAGPASDEEIVKQHALLKALSGGTTQELLSGGALGAASALGNLDGPAVGDAAGTMGLGLRGTGTGGGGVSNDTVGIGPVGTKGVGLGTAGGVGKVGRPTGQSELGIDEPGDVQGGLDREVIRRVILSHRAQIRYCYEKQLNKTPDLAGKVLVEFVIGGDGKVTQARAAENTLSDAEVSRCLVSKVRTWTFPQPKGGGVVVVTYPFLFKPAGQGAR